MAQSKEAARRYYSRLRSGFRPLGDIDRVVAQAVADGANSLNDVAAATGMGRDMAYRSLCSLRGHGIVVPPFGGHGERQKHQGGLSIAPGYVVHNNEIYILMKVGT
jgi:hypothetical protein